MKEYNIIHTTIKFIEEILRTEHKVQHGSFTDIEFGSKPEHYGRFLFEDYNERGDKRWSACDNRDGHCYIEDFDSLGEALAWLIDYCEEE